MINIAQLDTGGFSEFGVLSQHFDRKGNLVGYALSRWLALGPKLKIFKSVVGALTVDVANSFIGREFAAKMLFHFYAMKKFLYAAVEMQAHVSRRMYVPSGISWTPFPAFVSAFFSTKALLLLVAGFSTVLAQAWTIGSDFATKLTLKSRRDAVVHAPSLASIPNLVKENF